MKNLTLLKCIPLKNLSLGGLTSSLSSMRFPIISTSRNSLRHPVILAVIFFAGINFLYLRSNVERDCIGEGCRLNTRYLITQPENIEKKCFVLRHHVNGAVEDLKAGKGRYDNKRLIRIYDFQHTGSDWETLVSRYDVCFATQTSVDRIYWLPYILEKWTGPLSVAVFITSEAEWLILNLFMCHLSHCHVTFRSQVSVHVAVPTNITSTLTISKKMLAKWNITDFESIYEVSKSCPSAKSYLKFLLNTFPTLDKEHLKLKEVYPQSHMRNIARKACGGSWTYSADVDIIPRDGMADMLQEFYEKEKQSTCKKCAYVIPTFEMNETFPFPKTKKGIVKLFKTGAARQFHGKFFMPGHSATDYDRWVATNMNDGKVKISHKILEKRIKMYEPFYVSSDDIPPYDERFLGYGFTRNSQFTAAHEAGWTFFVLSPVFSIHWGLQTNKTLLYPKKDGVGRNVRVEQTNRNSKLYKKITKELQLKKKLDLF